MASTLTLVLFKRVRCFYLMRTHATHTLAYTNLFHSCVSRARTLHASARSPLGFFVWRVPACHNGLFYTDEGLCPKRLYIF